MWVQISKAATTNIEKSGLLRPVVDKTYSLKQIAEAHAYVEQGHKKGNVIITI